MSYSIQDTRGEFPSLLSTSFSLGSVGAGFSSSLPPRFYFRDWLSSSRKSEELNFTVEEFFSFPPPLLQHYLPPKGEQEEVLVVGQSGEGGKAAGDPPILPLRTCHSALMRSVRGIESGGN